MTHDLEAMIFMHRWKSHAIHDSRTPSPSRSTSAAFLPCTAAAMLFFPGEPDSAQRQRCLLLQPWSAHARPRPRAAWTTCPLRTLSSRIPASFDAHLCTGSSCRRSLPARPRSTRSSGHRALRSRAHGSRRAYWGPSPALASASGPLRSLGGSAGSGGDEDRVERAHGWTRACVSAFPVFKNPLPNRQAVPRAAR